MKEPTFAIKCRDDGMFGIYEKQRHMVRERGSIQEVKKTKGWTRMVKGLRQSGVQEAGDGSTTPHPN
jgi:hypothetical protein